MKSFVLLISILLAGRAFAQHEEIPDTLIEGQPDTLSLYQAFRHGKTTGHFRYFFMATDNSGALTDYYAHALGGGLKFETAPFRKFQLGVSGFFIYNILSSDLGATDPLTQQHNRYEISLFDLEDPDNKNDIDRLEELYLKYNNNKLSITLGKQLINTPFINPQDSRMRPTEVEGIFAEGKAGQGWTLEGGWIYNVSPRSTVEWYSVANSIGINAQGVTPDGVPADYRDNLTSKGIGLSGISYKPSDKFVIKAYNQYADNLFNTALVQAEYQQPLNHSRFKAAIQYIRQDVVNNGGNEDPSKTYFDRRNKVNVFGGRLGWQKGNWETTVNYTRIGKTGRYTMPREWGTEPFFTYLSRERNEGLGDVHAFMASLKGLLPQYHLKLEMAYGHYYVPGEDNAVLNKYGMPSYRHIKALADYEFHGMLKGLDVAMLWVYKGHLGSPPADLKYVFNKVDMSMVNLIMNFHF